MKGRAMTASYHLSDLQALRPMHTDAQAPFARMEGHPRLMQSSAADCHVLHIADEHGLWLFVQDIGLADEYFESFTGFNKCELKVHEVEGIGVYALKDGAPMLPFPFTAAQLMELNKRTGGVFSGRMSCGSEADELIVEIAQISPKSAELARALLFSELPPEKGATPTPAAGAASNAPAPLQTSPTPVEPPLTVMKRNALIAALEYEWPSIKADLSEATRNELKGAAGTGKHGEWYVEPARAWAQRKGKLKQAAPAHPLASVWSGEITRSQL